MVHWKNIFYFYISHGLTVTRLLKKDFGHLNHLEAVKGFRSFEVGVSTFCIAIWPGAYKGQRALYSAWDENDHHRLIYLNSWSPVRGTV